MKNEIKIFKNQGIRLEVNMKDETVWLTQIQIAKLFKKSKSTINEHIKNIYKEEELIESETMRKIGISEFGSKPTNYYNLDVIISVGYRVKSQNGVIFRKWASNILKDYLIKGYSINQKRLEYLEKTVKLIEIANRKEDILDTQSKEILKVIGKYSKSLNLLDDYDHKKITKPKGTKNEEIITYDNCISLIKNLSFNNSGLFGIERNKGLESIIRDIYLSFDGKDLYETIEEKASNFLYMIIKNHVFIDGNKRIGATLFIYFLFYYDILYKNGEQLIDNNTLVAVTLLIAESNPKEKNIIVDLVMNLLTD